MSKDRAYRIQIEGYGLKLDKDITDRLAAQVVNLVLAADIQEPEERTDSWYEDKLRQIETLLKASDRDNHETNEALHIIQDTLMPF